MTINGPSEAWNLINAREARRNRRAVLDHARRSVRVNRTLIQRVRAWLNEPVFK